MKRAFFVVIAVLISLLSLDSFPLDRKDYEARQVKALPPVIQTDALPVKTHIRHTERPEETFPFPIEVGEIGPVAPLYAGGPQYPFYCMTLDSQLGQPLVDNQNGWGVPVYDDQDKIIGYSKDCSVPTQVRYVAEMAPGKYQFFDQTPPEGYQYIYRFEQGTINRFIYAILMPITLADIGIREQSSKWNKRLIYLFSGGSGIGFRQGRLRFDKLTRHLHDQLHQGYALITSTGNKTSYTYNMLLAEDTARRVKKQFTSLYGDPDYTVGIGGSGGALAQYLIGQNSTGILDGLIPLYSYPDMVSQTIYALDCDLLNSYYSFKSRNPYFWQNWTNRQKVSGLNARNGERHFSWFLDVMNQVLAGRFPTIPEGNSECINGWLGLASFVHNPSQGFLRHFFSDNVVADTQWTYWEDMVNLYGRDHQGYARSAWGNQGIQYGLAALRRGEITPEQFVHLNWYIGSWKPMEEMQPETIWAPYGKKSSLWLTLWSRHNITQANQPSTEPPKYLEAGFHSQPTPKSPAPRREPDSKAIEAAYRSGQVFIGNVELPIIDLRHYLENELDMHHLSASFSSRIRIQEAKGHAKHQVIWVSHKSYFPITEAFDLMDAWLKNIKASPQKAVWQNKPQQLQDACIDKTGDIIHQGNDVWNGPWNNQATGKCMQRFKVYSNSRIQAGGPWQGSVFKCHLISVEQAIKRDFYGNTDIHKHKAELEQIFPEGVCDYSRGDSAKPLDL